MVKITPIALTREVSKITASQLSTEQTILSGKFGGTCYAAQGYQTIRTQPADRALKRANDAAKSGHHSVFGHSIVNMEIVCPKIIAMLLNSIGVSNTSEKSARYTVMEPESEKEKELYHKWHDIFAAEIKKHYSGRFTPKETDKLAYENARYLISVFCPTSMVYSLPFRNFFYVLDWTDRMIDNLGTLSGKFNERLRTELFSLREALLSVVGTRSLHDNKNEYFRFLPVQATSVCEENAEYYGDVYTARALASFAEVAQQQRHRTTRVKVNFGGDAADEYGFYVPLLIRDTDRQDDWLADEKTVAQVYPQGTLVAVTEQGLFEDFVLKCKERMCGRAQLEIMQLTAQMICRFEQNKENLSAENRKRLERLLIDGAPCARCDYVDFTCKEGCTWGSKEALRRLV